MRLYASAVLIFALVGCSNPFASDRRNIGLYVDEVLVPVSAPATGTLSVAITVVTGGCKQFERFEITRKPTSAVIETRGTDGGPHAICTQDLRFEKKTIELSGPFAFPFTVSALQPDGSVLVRMVSSR